MKTLDNHGKLVRLGDVESGDVFRYDGCVCVRTTIDPQIVGVGLARGTFIPRKPDDNADTLVRVYPDAMLLLGGEGK